MEKKLSEDATRPASSNDTNMQTIARAVAILRAVERDPDGLSLGAIAKTLSLPRSSVQRLVDALKSEGFLIPASPRGGVRLGPMLLRLASGAALQQIYPNQRNAVALNPEYATRWRQQRDRLLGVGGGDATEPE